MKRDSRVGSLLLRSSRAVTKEAMQMAPCFGRPSPDPRFGAPIEVRGGHARRLLDLISVGKTLSRERIASKEAPPAFLQIEPACSFGNEHMLEAWMLGQPGACFQAVVEASIVRDEENVPHGIVRFDALEQFNVVPGIARSRTAREFLAIANA